MGALNLVLLEYPSNLKGLTDRRPAVNRDGNQGLETDVLHRLRPTLDVHTLREQMGRVIIKMQARERQNDPGREI